MTCEVCLQKKKKKKSIPSLHWSFEAVFSKLLLRVVYNSIIYHFPLIFTLVLIKTAFGVKSHFCFIIVKPPNLLTAVIENHMSISSKIDGGNLFLKVPLPFYLLYKEAKGLA